MKLRKAIELTIRKFGDTETYTVMYDPSDSISLDYWCDHKRLVSKRVVYRLASFKLHNWTTDGVPF